MEQIKSLFFSNTLKRWHFEDIVRTSKISRERVNHYLKLLLKQKFIIKIKPNKKMPYFIANKELESFRIEKRMNGLKLIQESGLFEHINSLKNVKTAMLFGSFARGDWNNSSDIDLFIYGNCKNFEKGLFELKTGREIQLFNYHNTKGIKKLDVKLIPNIVKGFNIKGSLEPFKVYIND